MTSTTCSASSGKSLKVCPAPARKIFRFHRRANQRYTLAPSCPAEGRWPSSRTLGRDAVDAAASGAKRRRRAGSPVSEQAARRRPALVPRLCENCGGRALTDEVSFAKAGCVRRSRVVLASVADVKLAEAKSTRPGLMRLNPSATVTKRNSSPGRSRRKPLKPLRGESRVSRCTRGDYPVLPTNAQGLRVQRAPGFPCAL
jgi:hypothetical protein